MKRDTTQPADTQLTTDEQVNILTVLNKFNWGKGENLTVKYLKDSTLKHIMWAVSYCTGGSIASVASGEYSRERWGI